MLLRTDPFRELERLSMRGPGDPGTRARPTAMPLDAWQEGSEFVVELDLPGVDPDSIDLDIERNVLTVRAERKSPIKNRDYVMAERPRGVFSRQLILGERLDAEGVRAGYDGGVLTLRIPVAERARARKIKIDRPGLQDRSIEHTDAPDQELIGA